MSCHFMSSLRKCILMEPFASFFSFTCKLESIATSDTDKVQLIKIDCILYLLLLIDTKEQAVILI